jgi:hypothetical protein
MRAAMAEVGFGQVLRDYAGKSRVGDCAELTLGRLALSHIVNGHEVLPRGTRPSWRVCL